MLGSSIKSMEATIKIGADITEIDSKLERLQNKVNATNKAIKDNPDLIDNEKAKIQQLTKEYEKYKTSLEGINKLQKQSEADVKSYSKSVLQFRKEEMSAEKELNRLKAERNKLDVEQQRLAVSIAQGKKAVGTNSALASPAIVNQLALDQKAYTENYKAYAKLSQQEAKYTAEKAKATSEVTKYSNALTKENSELQKLESRESLVTDKLKKHKEEIKSATKEQNRLTSEYTKATNTIEHLNDRLRSHQKELTNLTDNLKNKHQQAITGFFSNFQSATMAFTQAFDAIGNVQRNVLIQSASTFENLQARMLTALRGNKQAAKETTDYIIEYARTTPYQLTEVTDAVVRLINYGQDVKKVLPAIGDFAAAYRKEMWRTVEAVQDALVGQYQRIKLNFGVTKAMISKHAKELNSEVKLNSQGIVEDQKVLNEALLSWIEKRTKGSSEALSQTFQGAWSNLQDSMQIMYNEIGKYILPMLADITLFITKMVVKFKELPEWVKSGTASLVAFGLSASAIGVPISTALISVVTLISTFKSFRQTLIATDAQLLKSAATLKFWSTSVSSNIVSIGIFGAIALAVGLVVNSLLNLQIAQDKFNMEKTELATQTTAKGFKGLREEINLLNSTPVEIKFKKTKEEIQSEIDAVKQAIENYFTVGKVGVVNTASYISDALGGKLASRVTTAPPKWTQTEGSLGYIGNTPDKDVIETASKVAPELAKGDIEAHVKFADDIFSYGERVSSLFNKVTAERMKFEENNTKFVNKFKYGTRSELEELQKSSAGKIKEYNNLLKSEEYFYRETHRIMTDIQKNTGGSKGQINQLEDYRNRIKVIITDLDGQIAESAGKLNSYFDTIATEQKGQETNIQDFYNLFKGAQKAYIVGKEAEAEVEAQSNANKADSITIAEEYNSMEEESSNKKIELSENEMDLIDLKNQRRNSSSKQEQARIQTEIDALNRKTSATGFMTKEDIKNYDKLVKERNTISKKDKSIDNQIKALESKAEIEKKTYADSVRTWEDVAKRFSEISDADFKANLKYMKGKASVNQEYSDKYKTMLQDMLNSTNMFNDDRKKQIKDTLDAIYTQDYTKFESSQKIQVQNGSKAWYGYYKDLEKYMRDNAEYLEGNTQLKEKILSDYYAGIKSWEKQAMEFSDNQLKQGTISHVQYYQILKDTMETYKEDISKIPGAWEEVQSKLAGEFKNVWGEFSTLNKTNLDRGALTYDEYYRNIKSQMKNYSGEFAKDGEFRKQVENQLTNDLIELHKKKVEEYAKIENEIDQSNAVNFKGKIIAEKTSFDQSIELLKLEYTEKYKITGDKAKVDEWYYAKYDELARNSSQKMLEIQMEEYSQYIALRKQMSDLNKAQMELPNEIAIGQSFEIQKKYLEEMYDYQKNIVETMKQWGEPLLERIKSGKQLNDIEEKNAQTYMTQLKELDAIGDQMYENANQELLAYAKKKEAITALIEYQLRMGNISKSQADSQLKQFVSGEYFTTLDKVRSEIDKIGNNYANMTQNTLSFLSQFSVVSEDMKNSGQNFINAQMNMNDNYSTSNTLLTELTTKLESGKTATSEMASNMVKFNMASEKVADSTAKIANNMQTINTITAGSVEGLGNFITPEQAFSNPRLQGGVSQDTSFTMEEMYKKYISNSLPSNIDPTQLAQIEAYAKNEKLKAQSSSAGSPEGWVDSQGKTKSQAQSEQDQMMKRFEEGVGGLLRQNIEAEKTNIDKQAESINQFSNAVTNLVENGVGGSSGDEGGGSGGGSGGGGGTPTEEDPGEGYEWVNQVDEKGYSRRVKVSKSGSSKISSGDSTLSDQVQPTGWGIDPSSQNQNYSGSTGSYQNQQQNYSQNSNSSSQQNPYASDGSGYQGLYYQGGTNTGVKASENKVRWYNKYYQDEYYKSGVTDTYRKQLSQWYTSSMAGMGYGVKEAFSLGATGGGNWSFNYGGAGQGFDLPANDRKAIKVGEDLVDRSTRDYADFVRSGMVAQAEKINKNPEKYFGNIPYSTNIKKGLYLPTTNNNVTNNSPVTSETKNINIYYGKDQIKLNPTLSKKAEEFSTEAIAYNGLTAIG